MNTMLRDAFTGILCQMFNVVKHILYVLFDRVETTIAWPSKNLHSKHFMIGFHFDGSSTV